MTCSHKCKVHIVPRAHRPNGRRARAAFASARPRLLARACAQSRALRHARARFCALTPTCARLRSRAPSRAPARICTHSRTLALARVSARFRAHACDRLRSRGLVRASARMQNAIPIQATLIEMCVHQPWLEHFNSH